MREMIGPLCLLVIVAVTMTLVEHAAAATSNECAVLRVSSRFIDDLLDDNIETTIPFDTDSSGTRMSGKVFSRARLTLEMLADGEDAHFLVRVKGNACGHFCGARKVLRVGGSLAIPYRATREIRFDGHHFVAEPTQVHARLCAEFSRVTTRRDGPLGRFVGHLANPIVQSMKPEAEQAAAPEAREYVGRYVDRKLDELIEELNRTTPAEESVYRLFPQVKSWRTSMATTPDHLVVRFVPPGQADPILPAIDRSPRDAAVEFWIRSTAAEAAFIETVAQWNATHDLLQNLLGEEDREVAELLEDATVTAIGPWLVIAIGQRGS